jgi:hypothetical protein
MPSKASQRMMPAEGGFKPGFIHIRAFMTAGSEVRRPRAHDFFFTSLMLEKTMPSARSRV